MKRNSVPEPNREVVRELLDYVNGDLNVTSRGPVTATTELPLNLDSLAIQELIIFIERHFQIVLERHDVTYDNFKCVEALAELIETKGTAARGRWEADSNAQ